jgi:transposase-like protein
VTAHPNAAWVTQQARNVAGDIADTGIDVKFLVRDRDTKYVANFDEVFRSENARILMTPYRTPNANAYAERFVRTIRSECLDHLLVVNARHLECILRSYARHYNGFRPHQGLSQQIPAPTLPSPMLVAKPSRSHQRHVHRRGPAGRADPRIRARSLKEGSSFRTLRPGDHSVIGRVARQLGVSPESLRGWVKQADIDAGTRAGLTTTEQSELKELRKENRELRRSNAILQAAATFFGAELDRRQKK